MREFAIELAIGIPGAALFSLLAGLWRQRHPWRPGRLDGWLYDRAERKVAGMPELTSAERARRIALLQAERNTPPLPQREFGEQFRFDFLVAVAGVTFAALMHLLSRTHLF